MSTRSSERIRKKAETDPVKVTDTVKYFSGQGLAIRSGSSFTLAVCLDDVNSDDQSFQVARLVQSSTANKYQEGEEVRIQETDILSDIDIKKSGATYRVTRKQLQDLRKDLGMIEEKPPRASSNGPSKRAKSAKPKKGKINPNIIVTKLSEVKDSKSSEPLKIGSVIYHDRNLHRAARTSNIKLLKSIVGTKFFISNFHPFWNPDNRTTPIDIAIKAGDYKFLKEFLAISQKNYSFGTANTSSINKVNTGSVSVAAYGVHVRSVNMSRGGREGNNAFLADIHVGNGYLSLPDIMSRMAQWVTPKMYDFLVANIKDYNDDRNSIGLAVRAGNLALAQHLMEAKIKNGGYGFNQLHIEVLGDKPLTPFKKVSVTKKPIENFLVAPLHCAAINPDPRHLESLISQCDDLNYADNQSRKAIHYAAACSSGRTMKLLLDSGANANEFDRYKNTPLMIAAEFNRREAAEVLLNAGVVATAKNRQGDSAICIAATQGSIDVLRLLLDSGVDIESTGTSKRTPLICAAMMGNFECVEELINRGAKVLKRDKLRKTALLYAVKNGELAVASLLLHNGADPNDPDSSKNYPLHYAASGCWPECIELLLEAGADINAQNDWKLSPLLIALLKGHSGIVSQLLKKPGIDVNCKDESGRTILSLAVEMLSDETIEQMEYLLTTKGADPNIPDLGGDSALHHLAGLSKPIRDFDKDWTKSQIAGWVENEWNLQVKACELLLRLGADVNQANALGTTPILKAVVSKNTKLIHTLVGAGADLNLKDSTGRNILHLTAQFDKSMWDFILQILQDKSLVDACLNSYDDEGYTPFLQAIKHFSETHGAVYGQIQAEVNEEFGVTGSTKTRSAVTMKTARRLAKTPRMKAAPRKTLMSTAISAAPRIAMPALRSIPFGSFPAPASIGGIGKSLFSSTSMSSQPTPFQFLSTPAEEEEEESEQVLDNNPLRIQTEVNARFNALVDEFIGILRRYIEVGADPNAKVEKLKKYRDDPELIKKEYEESKLTPVQPQGHYWMGQTQQTKREFFIVDFEGVEHWNEYNGDGLGTVLHLACKFSNASILQFISSQHIDLNARNFNGSTALSLAASNRLAVNLVAIIIEAKADLNIVNHNRESPLLKATESGYIDNVVLLLKSGALPDLQSKSGDSALKIAVNQKNLKLVEALCEGGADTNLPDLKLRTALHHAFNMAETSADASFDIEAALLEHGANINAKDKRGRTPLHYAFVKIGKPNDSKFIDPIETVSSACSIPGLDVNLRDFWGKTPLHYSAQHGSITSAMFLMSKEADFEIQDNCGNTALTLSYIYGHPNYSFMMIQKGSSVTLPVTVPPKKKKKKGVEAEEAENEGNYYEEEEVEDEQQTQQTFGMFGTQQRYDMWGNPIKKQEDGVKMKEGVYSQFKAAVIHEWQGVAYLLLFNGFDYMLAMQDAMSEHKFQLVLTLLAKVQDNSIIQQVNSKGQNLYHTLAMYGANANYELTTAIGEKLLKRKVKIDIVDQDLRLPLHYAAETHYSFLVIFLIDHGCSVDAKDAYGKTPLELAIQGKKITGAYDIIKTLKCRGANCNIQFTENGLTVTPLIHAIKKEAHIDLIKLLLSEHAVVNVQDSLGRTPLMHAVIKNNTDVIEALINTGVVQYDISDNQGKNVIHYIVKSCEYGSYENTDLLKLIHSATSGESKKSKRSLKESVVIPTSEDQLARYTKLDNAGYSPYWYAAHQGSGRMKKALEKLQITQQIDIVPQPEEPEPRQQFDFHEDSNRFISQQQGILTETIEPRKPDPTGNFEKYYEVVDEYDILMTKIDIKFGPYGGYVFYRMQLLKDVNRNVIVLFTRWGRIGEEGMSQRTAFSDLATGEVEFRKIFKQKSGNDFGTDFVPVKGKYKLLQLNFKKVKHNDFLKPLDYEGVGSQLHPKVAEAVKIVTDIKMYALQFRDFQINLDILNFSNIPLEAIDEAERILKDISKRNKRIASGKITDTNETLTLKQEVMDLSSRYYELIPRTGYENRIIPPIQNDNDLKTNFELLQTLRNVEAASKMLLGAKLREKVVNPLDYIVDCMHVSLSLVENKSPEHRLIAKYMVNGSFSLDKVGSIIRVNRHSETERIKQWADVRDRKLLWHGSTNANFVGILSQGLKIAPAEAPAIGWMFGKGLYFADNMSKSLGYTDQGAKDSFILLCEVVLGKLHTPETSFSTSKLPKGCMSTYAQGQQGPDYNQSVFLEDGLEVPCGPHISYENDPQHPKLVHYSEFIVYDASQVRIRYLVHLKNKV